MLLECSQVEKSFDKNLVLNGVSLTLNKGEILTILGESGCGKSTLLRLILGLEKVDEGAISIDDNIVATNNLHIEPNKRKLSMVFQDYALMPHLNVRKNILFSVPKLSKQVQKERLGYFAKLLKIENLLKRYIHELSGGQQQRVAVARALICQPKLILFDEPFSNLDENLKQTLRDELKKLIKKLNIGAIFVTHDKQDAFSISDKVALIKSGKIAQLDTPQALYESPNSLFVATFMGEMNFFAPQSFDNKNLIGARVEGCHFKRDGDGLEVEAKDIIYAGSHKIVKLQPMHQKQLATVHLPNNEPINIGDKGFLSVCKNKIITFDAKDDSTFM